MPDIAGLKLIVPTSVAGSGVSVSASGKVTFTAATSVSVNGCFTASYDNYLVVMRGFSTGTPAIYGRMRASGSDNSTANSYTIQTANASSTTVSGGRGTASEWQEVLRIGNAQRSGIHIYLYGPFLAQPTAMRSVGADGTSDALLFNHAGTHNQSTSYDGISLYKVTGDMTGSLCVYGLSQ